jgi:parallel beta-helix repeat protein
MTWVDTAVVVPGGNSGTFQAELDALDTHTLGPVNVKSFGAVGDGVTDDTAAIQAAATAAASGELYLPPGNYRISGTITLPSTITVRGHGAVLHQVTNNTPTLRATSATAVTIEGLELVGVGSGDTASTAVSAAYGVTARAYGIWFDSCSNVKVRDVRLRQHRNAGIVLWHSSDVLVDGCNITGTRGQGVSSADSGIPNGDGTTAQFGVWVVSGYAGDDPSTMKGTNITLRDNWAGEVAHAYYIGPNYDRVTAIGNRFGYLSQHGFYVVPYKNLSITQSKGDAYAHGIKLQGQWQASYVNPGPVDVSFNQVTGDTAPAIDIGVIDEVSGSTPIRASTFIDGATVIGNTVSSGSHSGILLTGVRGGIVAKNRVRSTAWFGIYAYSFEGSIEDNEVGSSTGTIGDSTHDPIFVSVSPYLTSVVKGNKFRGINAASAPNAYITGAWNASVSPPIAWAGSKYHGKGAYVLNDSSKTYVATTGGVSAASGGPTGTGTGITDGTVVWDYVAASGAVDQGVVAVEGNRLLAATATEPTYSMSFTSTSVRLRANDFSRTSKLISTTTLVSLEDDGSNSHGGWNAGSPYSGLAGPGRPRRDFYGTNYAGQAGGPSGSVAYAVGDRVWNTALTGGSQPVMWVCVVGGTPGTWKVLQLQA